MSKLNLIVITTLLLVGIIALKKNIVAQSQESVEKKRLERKYDVVIVKGEFLKNFNGIPIQRLALMAFKDGKLIPIPFQIDERDRKGHLIMTKGKIAGKDEDNGALDGNDELVFSISDTGDRLPESERNDKIEIEITDPRNLKSHAWSYLVYVKDGDVPRSKLDYINYDPQLERIISKNYILGYRKGYMFYNDVIYPVSAGGDGKDFFDRIKLRIKVEFLGGKMSFIKNEDSIKAEVTGWVDGSVRVLQSTINYVKVFDMLPPVSFDSISEYYPHIHTSPIVVKFPFDLNGVIKTLNIKSIIADIIGDMPGLVGGNAYTNLSPEGFVYTGNTPLDTLKKIPKKGLVWGFASKKGVGTWFPRLVFPDVIYQYNMFYITDNVKVSNPPDDVPGEIGAGLTLDLRNFPEGINTMMSKESFMLKFETYFAEPGLTPQSAREWLDIQDFPLIVETRAGAKVQPPPPCKKIPSRPPWKCGSDGVITDVRDRKIPLKGIAFFIGGVEVDARNNFGGQRITDKSYHVFTLNQIKYLTNYYTDLDPITNTKNPMFSKIVTTDGKSYELLGCRSCGWAGLDDEGKVIYMPNTQIKKVEFNH